MIGQEKASTTLDMYTHAAPDDAARQRVLDALAAFSLPQQDEEASEEAEEGGSDGL